MPLFSFYLLIWGTRGHAVDRVAAFLVVASFAIGTAGFALLMSNRIDATLYGALALTCLVLMLGLVMGWRKEPARTAAAVA